MKLKKSTHNIHDWCFVSGRVNALESSLFTCQFFEKLLDINSFDDFFRQLLKSKLKDCFTTQDNIHDYERLIDAYFCGNVNEIKALSPDTKICDFFLLKYKLQDLKNYLKHKLSGAPQGPVAFVLTSPDIEYLWKEMEEIPGTRIKAGFFPPEHGPDILEALQNGLKSLKVVLNKDKDVLKNNIMFIIDLVMDNAYLCYIEKMCEYFSVEYAKTYLKMFIFINVIKSLLRAMSAGCNIELLKEHYLQGYLYNACFLDLINLPIKEWKEKLKKDLPAELVDCIISDKVEENINDMARGEIQLDNYLLDIVKQTKHIAFGPERVFGYLCGLDSEIYNLKLLIGGRINKIDSQLLRERMRNTYV